MKRLSTYLLAGIALLSASCSDFLDTAPKDALSPATTWKTETDAESFVVGCYNGLLDPSSILYLDCGSDIGYNNFSWEGWRPWGDGSLSSGNTGASFYDFAIIRRCNTVLENIDNVEFTTAGKKEELIAEAKAIRAYRYFIMNWWYGGVPIIGSYTSTRTDCTGLGRCTYSHQHHSGSTRTYCQRSSFGNQNARSIVLRRLAESKRCSSGYHRFKTIRTGF